MQRIELKVLSQTYEATSCTVCHSWGKEDKNSITWEPGMPTTFGCVPLYRGRNYSFF